MVTMLIVDDQPPVLEALRQCLALEPELQIVGEAEDGIAALALAQELHPDIVLTDIKMPHMDGIAATSALRELAPNVKVVIMTIYDDPATRARALEAGAVAFVGKHEPAEALIGAIRQVVGRKLRQSFDA